MKRLTLIGAALLACGLAHAQDDATSSRYAQAESFNWDVGNDQRGSGVRLTYGGALNDYLSLEVQGALGGGTDTVELKRLYGGYLRAQYPLTEAVSVYGRYGYAEAKFELLSSGGVVDEATHRGGSYGGGVAVRLPGVLGDRLSLTLDYTVYAEEGGNKADARSVGLRYELR